MLDTDTAVTDQEQVEQFLRDVRLLGAIEMDAEWYEMTGSLWETPGAVGRAIYATLTCNEARNVACVHVSVETTGNLGWQAFLTEEQHDGVTQLWHGTSYYCRTVGRWVEIEEQRWVETGCRLIARWDADGVRIEEDTREEWFK